MCQKHVCSKQWFGILIHFALLFRAVLLVLNNTATQVGIWQCVPHDYINYSINPSHTIYLLLFLIHELVLVYQRMMFTH